MALSPSILREREVEILAAERRLADDLGDTLRAFESSSEDAETLRRATQSLQEPFLLVVAGEFNAGKSAFINALVGERVLSEGVTPPPRMSPCCATARTPPPACALMASRR